jgi:hypothetical protein
MEGGAWIQISTSNKEPLSSSTSTTAVELLVHFTM